MPGVRAALAGRPMKPPSILVAGIEWPPETFLVRLIDGLLRGGVRVTVASARRPGRQWRAREGFGWIRQPAWSAPLPERVARAAGMAVGALGRAPGEATRLARSGVGARAGYRLAPLVGRPADVAYFPWNTGAIAHLPLFDRFRGVVVSCRGAQVQVAPHNPRRSDIRDGLRETFRRATYVHCVSRAIVEEAARYGLDPSRAVVIRPAVDATFFRPGRSGETSDGVFRVASVGSLIWRKGYEHALVALRRFVDRTGADVEYRIVGDGPDRERILFTAWDLGLEDRVRLPGRLDPEDVRRTLQACDVLLLPSHSEGIANAALEAMACGRPVVAADCGGMGEAVSEAEGRVVPVRDPEAMARALEELWRDPARRRRMGAAARRRVLEAFDLEAQVAAFAELFERAAG